MWNLDCSSSAGRSTPVSQVAPETYKATFALWCYPTVTLGMQVTWSSLTREQQRSCTGLGHSCSYFVFLPKPDVFSLPNSPSFLSTFQKTLPTIESQIREVLQKSVQELQKYRRGTPTIETEKLAFLTDVSININLVTELSRPFKDSKATGWTRELLGSVTAGFWELPRQTSGRNTLYLQKFWTAGLHVPV